MTTLTKKVDDAVIQELIRDYRTGLKLAIEGTGIEIERYLPSIQNMRNLVGSLVFAKKIIPGNELAIYKILDRLRYGILSNNSAEKYDSKFGLVNSEDFQRALEEALA